MNKKNAAFENVTQAKAAVPKRGGTVTGRLVRDGKPLLGITVSKSQIEKSIVYSGREYLAKTDKHGRFVFENVPADDNVSTGKFEIYRSTVRVRSSRAVTV